MKHELKSEYMFVATNPHTHTHMHKYGTAVRSQICMRISVSDMGAFNNSEQSWGRILDVL